MGGHRVDGVYELSGTLRGAAALDHGGDVGGFRCGLGELAAALRPLLEGVANVTEGVSVFAEAESGLPAQLLAEVALEEFGVGLAVFHPLAGARGSLVSDLLDGADQPENAAAGDLGGTLLADLVGEGVSFVHNDVVKLAEVLVPDDDGDAGGRLDGEHGVVGDDQVGDCRSFLRENCLRDV